MENKILKKILVSAPAATSSRTTPHPPGNCCNLSMLNCLNISNRRKRKNPSIREKVEKCIPAKATINPTISSNTITL